MKLLGLIMNGYLSNMLQNIWVEQMIFLIEKKENPCFLIIFLLLQNVFYILERGWKICYTSSDSSAQVLYAEVFFALRPEGIFCNLEHLASPTKNLHKRFLFTVDKTIDTEDKSNKLLDMGVQLEWLRNIGFIDVDCYWKWLELALLLGFRP